MDGVATGYLGRRLPCRIRKPFDSTFSLHSAVPFQASNEKRVTVSSEELFRFTGFGLRWRGWEKVMIVSNEDGERSSSAHLPEMLVRTLRHEVGDLLQSVYSAVAILQERLPSGQTLERTILADLRGRAETCKNELDATHDLVCPLSLNRDWTDLSELSSGITAAFALRRPGLQVVSETSQPIKAWVDAPRLAHAGKLLMGSLCDAARKQVVVRTIGHPDIESAVLEGFLPARDGPTPGNEPAELADRAFQSHDTHASASRWPSHSNGELHGGRIVTNAPPQGGSKSIWFCRSASPTHEHDPTIFRIGEKAAVVCPRLRDGSSKKSFG